MLTTTKTESKRIITQYTPEDIKLLFDYPHLIGHLAGKNKLTDIHSDWIKYVWDDIVDFRSLRAFRGSYKSTSCVHIGPIYWLLFLYPNDRIFIIRKKFTDASDALETIHDMMMSDPIQDLFKYVQDVYPKAIIKRKEKITYNFKETSTPEGSLNAFGLDAAITGRHGDRFIFDDFITLKDRISKAEREHTLAMVREISTNVIDPGKPISYLGTPWHKEDAWKICPTPIDFPVGSIDGILSLKEIAKKRSTTTSSLWAANYELKHVADDDALFKEPRWGEWQRHGVELIRGHLDAAFDGDHYCAFTVMGRLSNGKLQAFGKSFAGNVKLWTDEVVRWCKQYGVRKVYVEDNPDKGYTADELKSKGVAVSSYSETTNKHVKISTFLLEVWDDITWSEDLTDGEYMSQILDYREKQEPDDGCFVAGTKVATILGDKNIEDIRKGDKVLTPFGLKEVLVSGCTGDRSVISKFGLIGTKNHKIYNQVDNSFNSLDSLTSLDRVNKLSLRSLLKWEIKRQLFLMERNILEVNRCDIISVFNQHQSGKVLSNYIKLFGNFIIRRKSLKDSMFIIKILIQIIMTFLIWSCWKELSIFRYMLKEIIKIRSMLQRIKSIWRKYGIKLKNGMGVKKVWNGIKNIQKDLYQSHGLLGKNEFVNIVKSHIQQSYMHKDSVLLFAHGETELISENNMNCNVNIVEKSIKPNIQIGRSIAMINVKAKQEREQRNTVPVYNLTVEDVGVYYANGSLVSNCDSAASLIRAAFSKKSYARSERYKW